jgi:hypothetical protein
MGSLRKAYGALKDSTRVGLAKVNSDFKVNARMRRTAMVPCSCVISSQIAILDG